MRFWLAILIMGISFLSIGQVIVSDSLLWVSGTQQSSQTSPDFDFCNQSTINYTLSTTSPGGFKNITATSNNTIPNGAIFPASTSTNYEQSIPISLDFSQAVDQLWIKFVDLDEDHDPFLPDPEEYLDNFSIYPDTVVNLIGAVILNGTEAIPDGNNTAVWMRWNTTLSSLSLNFHKPGNGYGLVISEVKFGCDTNIVITIPPPLPPGPPPPPVVPEPEIPCDGTHLFVPNVITPNQDDLNDLLIVNVDPCWKIEHFTILNRWGNKIRNYTEAPIVWDGTTDGGKEVAEGTYFWIIEYELPDGEQVSESGFITLIK